MVVLLLTAMIHGGMASPKEPKKEGAQISVVASPIHQKKALIKIDNLTDGRKSFLKIRDEKGRLLHAETIHKGSSFVRSYDFSKLKGKAYIIEVRNQAGTTKEKFVVQEKESIYFEPVIKTEKNMIRVVFQNPLEHSLSLKLYDHFGHVVYNNTVAPQEVFAHGLDVTNIRNKQFRLSIKTTDYSFSKNISAK